MQYTAHLDRFVIDRLPPPEDWPELIFERPELQFPQHLNACVELLDKAVAEGHADRLAIIGKDIRWTYRDLQETVDRLANLLVGEMGLVPGNRVLLRGANTPWLAACWLAVWKAGGVAVGTMPLLRAKELREVVRLARVSHALCDAALADELIAAQADTEELREIVLFGEGSALEARLEAQPAHFAAVDTAATDPALIGFTSGTTGIEGHGTFPSRRDGHVRVFPATVSSPPRTTSSSARRRWHLPSVSAACCAFRYGREPPRCCSRSSTRKR